MKPYESYKKTKYDWLPNIPEHWQKNTIRSITKLSNERNAIRNDLELLSVYREYGVIKKSSRDDNHNVESTDLSNYKFVDVGYLVMNKMKMWQGSLGVSEFKGIVSPAYIVCKITKEMNCRYFHFLLRSPVFKTYYNCISYGVRVGQWDMRYDDFKQLEIFLPPLPEQDQIVRFLDWKLSEINKLIKAKKKQIALLNELKKAVVDDAVTHGLDRNTVMKYSGVDWLGNIPSHWSTIALRQLLSPISIKNKSELPLLSVFREQGVIIRDVDDKESNHNFIPDDLSGYKVVEKGQFAMNKMKAWQGSYGISPYTGIVSPAYYIFNVNFDNLEYFHYAIRSKVYVNFFAQASDGIRVGQWDLSLQKMKGIPFIVPPLEEQKEIIAYIPKAIKRFENGIEKFQREVELLIEYKTSLISSIVTGKVDVRDVAVPDFEVEDEVLEDETEAFSDEIEASEVDE
ncbi:MAG: restriction endonuclease subunit [Bacillus sp. (in: firmicutes)]|jgi:type I restriction enzyme S subunit|nr:restriction endonuclease subunit [Bacillus sp. (in: firmicutes)]